MDGPGIAYVFPTLANQGDVNENGKTYDIYWAVMRQEEV